MSDTQTRYRKRKPSFADSLLNFFISAKFIVTLVFIYIVTVGLLLLAEMNIAGLSWLRATDRIIFLFVLLFMPFFVVAAPKFVNSLTLKFGGGREVEVQLNKVSEHVDDAIDDIKQKLSRQVSTAEQSLWPLIAGVNHGAELRWKADRPEIIIGSKQDLSQKFFSHFLRRWIEKHHPQIKCTVRYPNGGSLKNFIDVKHRWVDLYIDYTGTCLQYFSINHRNYSDEEQIRQLNAFCNPLDMEFLPRLGLTEDYLLVMRQELAEELEIGTIRELTQKSASLTFTADSEYLNRADCWQGLQKEYGMKFKEIIPCSVTNRYALLEDDLADVFVGYESDPEIKRHKLKRIEDDKMFFPSYAALPLVNSQLLKVIPELRTTLEKLQDTMTTDFLNNVVREISDGIRDFENILDDAEEYVQDRVATETG